MGSPHLVHHVLHLAEELRIIALQRVYFLSQKLDFALMQMILQDRVVIT